VSVTDPMWRAGSNKVIKYKVHRRGDLLGQHSKTQIGRAKEKMRGPLGKSALDWGRYW